MRRPSPDELFEPPRKKQKPVPHAFVLDALAAADPYTRPMFGCTAVYVEDKIVLILREGREPPEVEGVWIATTAEHHASLRKELPSLRSISVLGPGVTGWQMIPADAVTFEEEVLHAVRLVLARDPRIGKVPKAKKPKVKAAPPRSRGDSARAGAARAGSRKPRRAPR
jgi:hypothetical protein